MGRKIFVSYKHSDNSVKNIKDYGKTARAYVDYLIDIFEENGEIYKGEGKEDLSKFEKIKIKNKLQEKIHDSNITLVLLSPNMKDNNIPEIDQWIPWEISYSLKEIKQGGKTSHINAIIAVVLPDINDKYHYFIEENSCSKCSAVKLKTHTLFHILNKNMLNLKKPIFSNCSCHSNNNKIYTGESSYILPVKWKDFIKNKDTYFKRTENIRNNRKDYNIFKGVNNG